MVAYCYACRADRPFRFAGNATDGREAADGKPRSFYQSCSTCSRTILTLGNVSDAQALCITIARRRVVSDRGVELDDAIAYLYWHLWRLYLSWQPRAVSSVPGATRSSFLGWAGKWLPRRLDAYIAEATGDVVAGRRSSPKPHSVSCSLDALVDGPGGDRSYAEVFSGRLVGGLDDAVGGDGLDADDDRSGDLGRILRRRDREGAGSVAL